MALIGSFNLDFAEQIEYFRRKINMPTETYEDIMGSAHDWAFVVAGAMKADLLADLHAAVSPLQRQSIEQFRENFRKIVEKHGWHGWTGEDTTGGWAWRTRLIYETNVRTSYAAGFYAQITDPEVVKRLPYWEYIHSDLVQVPRPLHKMWGDMHLTLRYDHPFWETHYPPNGWGCRCRVSAVSEPAPGAATEPPAGWDAINPKTGAPVGIDKGWAYAPGASRAEELRKFAAEKAGKLPGGLSHQFLDHVLPVLTDVVRPTPAPRGVEDFIAAGKKITDALPKEPKKLYPALLRKLGKEVGAGQAAKVASTGKGADLVKRASRHYPAAWVDAADKIGPLYVRLNSKARGFYSSIDARKFPRGLKIKTKSGVVTIKENLGHITVKDDVVNAIHEYAHRLQDAFPGLQALFKEFHLERTAGMPLKRLTALEPDSRYRPDEMTREDNYISPYWGKDYGGEPLEVMSMGLQTVLSGHKTQKSGILFERLYTTDREMFDFIVGILFKWRIR
jgi:hypothetical protein